MDLKLKILALIASEKVPPLMMQVVLLQAHQVWQHTIIAGGHLRPVFKSSSYQWFY